MTKEELHKTYNKIYDLREEFYQKWRKNDFRFEKEKATNEKRIIQIINEVVQIIQDNDNLEDIIFEGQDEDYRTHMKLRGFRVVNGFLSYVDLLLRKLEEKL